MRASPSLHKERMNIKELAYFEYLSRYSLPTNNQRLRRFEGTDKQLVRQALPLVAGAATAAAISLRDVFTAFSFSLAARPQKGETVHSGCNDTRPPYWTLLLA